MSVNKGFLWIAFALILASGAGAAPPAAVDRQESGGVERAGSTNSADAIQETFSEALTELADGTRLSNTDQAQTGMSMAVQEGTGDCTVDLSAFTSPLLIEIGVVPMGYTRCGCLSAPDLTAPCPTCGFGFCYNGFCIL